jgi:hypothetical protein
MAARRWLTQTEGSRECTIPPRTKTLAPSRACELRRRVVLELPIRSKGTVAGVDLPGITIQYQADSVFGSSAVAPGIFVKLELGPNPVDLTGMQDLVLATRQCRYWDAEEVLVDWVPNNIQHDGELLLCIVAGEEGQALTDYGYLRGMADVRNGPIGESAHYVWSETSMQLFAKSGSSPDGLHWGPGSLAPARRQQLAGTSAVICGTLVAAFVDYGQVYKTGEDFAIGVLRVTLAVRGYEPAVAPPLPFPTAALFPGWRADDGELTGATRQGSALVARGESITSLDAAHDFITALRKPFLDRQINPWFRRQYARVPLWLGLWPQVLGFAAQLGKDLISRFVSAPGVTAGFPDVVKWLALDMRDQTSCTEFDSSLITYTPTTVYDSAGNVITDAAVRATFSNQWDTLVVDDEDGVSLVNSRLEPGVGPSTRVYMQIPAFNKTTDMPSFGQGLSADAGLYCGPSVQLQPAEANGVGLLGTLIKYNQALPQQGNGFSLSNVFNGVKNAISKVIPVATAVANIFAADGRKTDGVVELMSSSIRPQGARNSTSRRVVYPIPQQYGKAHWVHWRPDRPEIFSRYCLACPLPDHKTASLEIDLTAIARFSGQAMEKRNFTYDGGTGHPPPVVTEADMEVGLTGPVLPVTLTFTPYFTHHPTSSIGTMNPAYLAPLTTPGINAITVTVEVPIIELIDVTDDSGAPIPYQAVALIDVECPVHLKCVVPFPDTHVGPTGDVVPYEPDEPISFGVQFMTEVCAQPRYEFTQIGDVPVDAVLRWHPVELVFGYNHPGDVGFSGQHATVSLRNYGAGQQRPHPVCGFTRRAVIGGRWYSDAAPANGGITYAELSVSIRNIIESDNPDQP